MWANSLNHLGKLGVSLCDGHVSAIMNVPKASRPQAA